MKQNKLILLLIIFSILYFQSFTIADSQNLSLGVFADYSLNYHQSDNMKSLPGIPSCCPKSFYGYGNGLAFGTLFELNMSRVIFLGIRLSYYDLSANLESPEENTILSHEGHQVHGAFVHHLETEFVSIGIDQIFKIKLFSDLKFIVGLHTGYLYKKNYYKYEYIKIPEGATFIDNGIDTQNDIRNENSGEIPSASDILLMPFGGFSYSIALNSAKTLLIEPEALIFLGSNSIITEESVKWLPYSLRAGLAFKYFI